MAEITISGHKVLVDDEDLERIQQYHWWVDKNVLRRTGAYYFRRKYRRNGVHTVEKLHRFIMCAGYMDGTTIDHISGNTLDNQKSNLRFCTRTENSRNKRRESRNTTGYKGVLIDSRSGHIYASVKYEQNIYNLGRYPSIKEAAQAYDHVSRLLFKEFASPNFPEIPYDREFAERVYAECVSDVSRHNSSGYTGVSWESKAGKGGNGAWKARYVKGGKTKWLGTFSDPYEAHLVREKNIESVQGSEE